jgi:hypothetical protein
MKKKKKISKPKVKVKRKLPKVKKVTKESSYPVHCDTEGWFLYCKSCPWTYQLSKYENAIVRANVHAKEHKNVVATILETTH